VTNRGRPPKPTALKLLTGNPGKRPINKAEPAPVAAALDAPEWLDPMGCAFWERYAPQLIAFGLLTELDVPEFAAACQQESLYQRLMATILRAPMGKRAQSLARRADAALANRDRILARFGFDPASRSKLSVKAPEPEDEFEALMRRKATQ
jgi:P27 family predicted phage terminase small subunit